MAKEGLHQAPELEVQRQLHVPVLRRQIQIPSGEPFTLDIFKKPENYPGPYHMLYGSPIEDQTREIRELVTRCYNDFDENGINAAVGYNRLTDRLDTIIGIVRNQVGELVGFNTHRTAVIELPDGGNPVKVLYTQTAAISHSERGKKLSYYAWAPIIELEEPDVISGETRIPQIMRDVERIADRYNYTLYPKDAETPDAIHRFGQSTFPFIFPRINNPQEHRPIEALERGRLVVKGSSRATRTVVKVPYPLFDNPVGQGGLGLAENEFVFFFGFKSVAEARVLASLAQG